MSNPSRKQEPERSLSHSVRDGVFASMQQGAGECYLAPFIIFLNGTTGQVALLASVPQLLGALFQFVSVKALRIFHKRKRVILLGASTQALMWLPASVFPFLFSGHAATLVIVCVTAYFLAGNFASPAWNSLMGDLVPPERRGTYFGLRSRYTSIASFLALCAGGAVLHLAQSKGRPWAGFFAIFLAVFTARMISVYHLSRMSEPTHGVDPQIDFPVLDFFHRQGHSNFRGFVYYIAAMNFSVLIASPFFTVYMLRDLQFSYLQFMAVSGTSVLSQFLTLQYWGRFSDRFGNRQILALTGMGLPVIPVLWLLSADFTYIIAIQMIGGFVWAGFSLSMGNVLFDTVGPSQRAKSAAIFNTINATGVFLGALFGAWLTSMLPAIRSLGIFSYPAPSNLPVVFLISGAFRLLCVLGFLPRLKEARAVEPLSVQDLFFRVSQLRPIAGLKFDVFTGYQQASRNANPRTGPYPQTAHSASGPDATPPIPDAPGRPSDIPETEGTPIAFITQPPRD